MRWRCSATWKRGGAASTVTRPTRQRPPPRTHDTCALPLRPATSQPATHQSIMGCVTCLVPTSLARPLARRVVASSLCHLCTCRLFFFPPHRNMQMILHYAIAHHHLAQAAREWAVDVYLRRDIIFRERHVCNFIRRRRWVFCSNYFT